MDGALRIIDRGAIFEAARYAYGLHQWLTAPDFDEEGEVKRAEAHLADFSGGGDPALLVAARGMHSWLEAGGARGPIRGALVRHWTRHGLLWLAVPLTGPAALHLDTPWTPEAWVPALLHALAEEAVEGGQLLANLEHAWFAARLAVAGRRRDSHAAATIDLLAASPLVSPTSLAAHLGVTVKTAIGLLDDLATVGLAVEVTHRAKRRLFGLTGMAPLRADVAPPERPEPGRGRGRPRILVREDPASVLPVLPPLTPLERQEFDYSDLETWMARAGRPIRHARKSLDSIARGVRPLESAPE